MQLHCAQSACGNCHRPSATFYRHSSIITNPYPGWFTARRTCNAIVQTYIDKNCQHQWYWLKSCLHKKPAVVYDLQQMPPITGWRETNGANIWRIALSTSPTNMLKLPTNTTRASLQAFRAYFLPSVDALVRYLHMAAGFPVRDTWLRAIKCGNHSSFPGLIYSNTDKYCPSSDKTITGHLVQSRQGMRSTKPKLDNSQTIKKL